MSIKIERILMAMIALLLITSIASGISSVDQGFQAGWFIGDAANGTIGGLSLSSLISSLQGNDTIDRIYVNTTFLPTATYSGDFPNSSLAGWGSDFPNSTLVNYLPIATYSGDFPNSTFAGYSGDFPNITVQNNLATWNATYNSTYDGHTALINALQSNDTTDRTYVNDTFLPIGTYGTDFPNTTISSYANDFPNTSVSSWNGDFPNLTVSNNLVTWNATYNSTYDGYLLSITTLQTNDSTDRTYVNDTFLPIVTYGTDYPNSTLSDYAGDFPNSSVAGWGSDFPNSSLSNYVLTALYNGNFPNSTVSNNLDNWNATYNSTYDAFTASKLDKTDASELSGGTLPIARLDEDIVYRSIQMTIYNSSGAIATGMKAQIFTVPINGTIETIELQNGAGDGNINMSVLLASSGIPVIGDLEGQINITSGNTASKTVTIPLVFGDRLKFYVDANAGAVTSTTISLRIRTT